MRCPTCGSKLDEDNYCSECYEFIDSPINDICPNCGGELDEDNYCSECGEFIEEDDELQDSYSCDYGEPDYRSMVNNGDAICLNCTFWSVSPYGRAHGMVCRKGQLSNGPDDSCEFFIQEHHFANYGDEGQFQFDETDMAIRNKLNSWENNRF